MSCLMVFELAAGRFRVFLLWSRSGVVGVEGSGAVGENRHPPGRRCSSIW